MSKPNYQLIITGANGQLGSAMQQVAKSLGRTCFAADYPELDITIPDALDRYCHAQGIDTSLPLVVVNCAAYTAVDAAESDEAQAWRINAEGVACLAEASARLGAYLIHISTDYVFDGTAHRPYTEDATTAPLGVYGHSKAAGEQAVYTTLPHGRGLVLRTAWLYGPQGHNFAYTMLRLAATRDSIAVVSDQLGTPTYAPHLAEAIWYIADDVTHRGTFLAPCLHYTDSGACSWYDMAYHLLKQAQAIPSGGVHPIATEDYPTAAQRPAYSVLSKKKINQLYNIVPPHWSEGIDKFLRQRHE